MYEGRQRFIMTGRIIMSDLTHLCDFYCIIALYRCIIVKCIASLLDVKIFSGPINTWIFFKFIYLFIKTSLSCTAIGERKCKSDLWQYSPCAESFHVLSMLFIQFIDRTI